MFAQFKMYFLMAAFAGAIIGTWQVRGWYEDGKIVDALKEQQKEHERLAKLDQDALSKSLLKQEALRNAYEGLKNEASKIKLCNNGGNDFLRLFNRSAVEANKKE